MKKLPGKLFFLVGFILIYGGGRITFSWIARQTEAKSMSCHIGWKQPVLNRASVRISFKKCIRFTERKIEEAISMSLEDAKQQGIQGKEVTPFILAAVAKATGGASLEASILL